MVVQEWLVTVSRTHAKVFEIREEGLVFVKRYDNPAGDARPREFHRDKPGFGRSRYMAVKAPHALDRGRDPLREVAQTFAHTLCDYLMKDMKEDFVGGLRISAEAHMIGYLKKAFAAKRQKIAIRWMEKDLDHLPTARLEKVLQLESKVKGPRGRARPAAPPPKNKFKRRKEKAIEKSLR